MQIDKVKPNWKQRVKFGILMASVFSFLIYMSPMFVMLTILVVQVLCYREILNIGYKINKITELPHFQTTAWFYLIVANYFLLVETVEDKFKGSVRETLWFEIFVKYHRFKSFCLYFFGIILFVFNLVGKYDVKKFRLLALIHVLLMLVVLQSYLFIRGAFEGLIWTIVPIALVILNDIFAYIFGKLMGRTRLIEVSPKKTWEGFIGGAVGTIVSGFILSYILCNYKYFVCPTEFDEVSNRLEINCNCTPSLLFQLTPYHITSKLSVYIYPFLVHSFYFSLFASIIAPFGGFFASGFKRAFKLKDFSDTIPGHGGIVDRFDCQYLMAMFLSVYMSSFIKTANVDQLYKKIMYLNNEEQVEFYYMMENALKANEVLGS